MQLLEPNSTAPMFTLNDKDGNSIALKDLTSQYTILYFYPKDNTPGCTTEALMFNKHIPDFNKLGAQIIGIGGGDDTSKKKFCEKNNLVLTLLSDPDFKVSKKYGAYGQKKLWGEVFNGINRVTYVLDEDKTILKVFDKVKPKDHAQELLEFLKSH